MDYYIKDKDTFKTFLNKLLVDIPKMDDNYRDAYVDIVEEMYPIFKDIGTTVKNNNVTTTTFTQSELGLLGFIHYRLKFDTSPIDESTRCVLKREAEKLMVERNV